MISQREVERGKRLEMNGVKEVDPSEFCSFIALMVKRSRELTIDVPADICRHLKLKRGSLVEVAIRRASRATVQEYGYRPHVHAPLYVNCPQCHKIGVMTVSRDRACAAHSSKKHHVLPKDYQPLTVALYKSHRKKILEALMRL